MKTLLFILLLLPAWAFSQQAWVLKKDQNNIKVYMREVEGSPFKEIKVKLVCKGELEKLKALLLDVDNHKEWVYNTSESALLEKINNNEVIYYTQFSLPWPVSNRDLSCHVKVITDSIPNTYFIKAHAIEGRVAPKEDVVRVSASRSFWKVVDRGNKELDIEYTIRVDPAGSLPPWLVNLTAVTGPYNSFSSLKESLGR